MQRDWTRDEDYADIPLLDDGGLAWEFLRRNPDYIRAYQAGEPGARWGLVEALDPALAAVEARPLWRWDVAPSVVVRLAPSPPTSRADFVSLAVLRPLAVASRAVGGCTELQFSNGLQAVVEGYLPPEQGLAAVIPLDGDFLVRATAARLLRSGVHRGWRPVSALSAPRRARLSLTLRALDGRRAGASYRVLARRLLRDVPETSLDWRTSSARAFIVRLCVAGRDLINGGYARLLHGRLGGRRGRAG